MNQKYKNISSIKLLDTVVEIMFNNNYTLINADLILLAEKPKIKRYKNKIAKNRIVFKFFITYYLPVKVYCGVCFQICN